MVRRVVVYVSNVHVSKGQGILYSLVTPGGQGGAGFTKESQVTCLVVSSNGMVLFTSVE